MERTELMKSSLKLPDTQSVSKISEWLAENRQGKHTLSRSSYFLSTNDHLETHLCFTPRISLF